MSPPAGQLAGFPPGAEMDKPAPGFFPFFRRAAMINTSPQSADDKPPFVLEDWLSSRLFSADAGSVQGDGAGREIGEHLPGHGMQCPVCGRSLQDRANVFEVGTVSSGERQQDMAQNLLNDVQ